MRIVLFALGSRGDTQPCVALGAAALRRGHDVAVAAPAQYASLVRGAGLTHHVLSVDPATVLSTDEGQAMLAGGPIGFVRGFRAIVTPLARRLLAEAAEAARGADVLLAPAVGGLGHHLGEATGVAHLLLHFQPSEPTAAFANPLVPRRRLGRHLNRASYVALEAATAAVLHGAQNRARRDVLGLPPLRRSTYHLDRRARTPVLCGFSALVQPRPDDWPGHVHLTGAWQLPARGTLDAGLRRFLDAGPPPVHVGFGSMVPDDPARLAGIVTAALRRAGVRGVVQGLPVPAAPDVHPVADVEHAALFGRVAAVVHHGGAGTTAAALGAGVPNVVCPFFADQPYWAARVVALGAGPAAVPQQQLSVDRLAEAVRRAVLDEPMRQRARALGRALSAQDGAGRAVELVESSVLRHRDPFRL